jgi:long-chain acyl-CoA synthetase
MPLDKTGETLVSLFHRRVTEDGQRIAIWIPAGSRPETLIGSCAAVASSASPLPGFACVTWSELAADATRMAVALRDLGLSPGDRFVQLSGNSYLWILIDLAVHLARGVHVALHGALPPEQQLWQLGDSGARLHTGAGDLLAFEESASGVSFRQQACSTGYIDLDLAQRAARVSASAADSLWREAQQCVRPGDLATILYTSGTTGEAKGVMLSHGNLAFNALASLEALPAERDDLRLCWLPLSHIFARTSDLYTWLSGAYTLALAASRETLMADMAMVRPTIINGVPYFYDKLMRALIAQGKAETPGALQKLMGGRIRACCAGGAPLPTHVAEFFQRHGVTLVQGYGLTESSPVISTCSPTSQRIGTVGPPIPGVEVRIAPDGEVLTRGPHVMLGYWKRPDETAAAIQDGWLHTGDLGELRDGYLCITGRKKELIVLASGKKIAPSHIEGLLTVDPLIAQAMVIGDGRNYLTALIVPDLDQLRTELANDRDDSAPCGLPLDDPRVAELFSDRITARLSGCANWEQIRRFTIVSRPFTTANDELTTTLKLRRGVLLQHYAAEVNEMYRASGDCRD